jgi:hypothetical protein
VRRAEPTAVAERVNPHTAATTALYDIVLLAGSPRRLTLRLAPDLETESVIEVDGEEWAVADVRTSGNGPAQLICIYAE